MPARIDRYVERLARRLPNATIDRGCLVLGRLDFCGYGVVRLARRSTTLLHGEAFDCFRWPDEVSCSYELYGRSGGGTVECTGSLGAGTRVIADQSLQCYFSHDPSWYDTEDGVRIRLPRWVSLPRAQPELKALG